MGIMSYGIRSIETSEIKNVNGDLIAYYPVSYDANWKFSIPGKLTVKKLIFNPPATIVYWTDGTKTVVKAQHEEFDEEKGLAMAYMKKTFKDWNKYGKILDKAERPQSKR